MDSYQCTVHSRCLLLSNHLQLFVSFMMSLYEILWFLIDVQLTTFSSGTTVFDADGAEDGVNVEEDAVSAAADTVVGVEVAAAPPPPPPPHLMIEWIN